MKRSDHVALYTPSLKNQKSETKKLRKRRELNAMVAPHVVIRGRSKRTHLLASTGAVQPQFFDSLSSSENEDEEDDYEDYNDKGYHAYINLAKKSNKNQDCWKRNQRFCGIFRGFCLCFVILSGVLVLFAMLWLHFALRAQTQELSAQLHKGFIFDMLGNVFEKFVYHPLQI